MISQEKKKNQPRYLIIFWELAHMRSRWLVMKLNSCIWHKQYVFNQHRVHGRDDGMFQVYVSASSLFGHFCRLPLWRTDEQRVGPSGGGCMSAPARCRRDPVSLRFHVCDSEKPSGSASSSSLTCVYFIKHLFFICSLSFTCANQQPPASSVSFIHTHSASLLLARYYRSWVPCELLELPAALPPLCIGAEPHKHSACERLAVRSPLIYLQITPASLITSRITGWSVSQTPPHPPVRNFFCGFLSIFQHQLGIKEMHC